MKNTQPLESPIRIGVSSAAVAGMRRWETLKALIEADFTRIEIYNHSSRMRPEDVPILKRISRERGTVWSMHSASFQLFNPIPVIAKFEQLQLEVEIWFCEQIKADRLILHLSRDYLLKPAQITAFRRLHAQAKKRGVELLVENNYNGRYARLSELRKIYTAVPGLRACFDIGHWKIAHAHGWMPSLQQTLHTYPTEIAEVHVHDNDAQLDYHWPMTSVTPEVIEGVHEILDRNANFSAVKHFPKTGLRPLDIIIEPRSNEEALRSARALRHLLDHFQEDTQ